VVLTQQPPKKLAFLGGNMQNEIMRMVLDQLIEYRDSTKDDRFDDSIDSLEALLSKAKKPITPDQARDLYKQLPNGWKPLEFVQLVEKFHGIK
jgi:hypothetical protein